MSTCRKDEPARAPAPSGEVRSGPQARDLPQGAGVEGQLSAEAAARRRDQDTVTLEQLTVALAGQKVSLGAARQVMARSYRALYCAIADGPHGMTVTVCEYPSPDAAVAGEREAHKLGQFVSGHQARINRSSVLYLVAPSTAPPSVVTQVLEGFAALAH